MYQQVKMKRIQKWGKRLLKLMLCLLVLVLFMEWWLHIPPPTISDTSAWNKKRTIVGKNHYTLDNNWLRKNKQGLWEAYIEGAPFERGAILGNLAQELIVQQEVYFVAQIKAMIPSNAFLYLLRYMIGFFNRHLDHYVPIEYQQEIYGETHFCSNEFKSIGSNYERILNYHAAHDIGHALSDYAVVGCTAFAGWNNKSTDSSLIIGRNFDFYVGDDFAKDKMILFIAPEKGYKMASITWGGFMGVVSGMNEKGLTVTLNAAKSGIPSSAKTPISIVARQILQYAKNIQEAYLIAKKFDTFVSESILIGSAEDGQTAIIEKSVDTTALYYSDSSLLICSNHYQGTAFDNDKDNLHNIASTASDYRQRRTLELIQSSGPLNYNSAATILRDRKGIGAINIGLGNEKAVNQLQGHHAVIFKPKQRLMWVSTAPYQLGAFVAYDLNKVFAKQHSPLRSLATDSLMILPDSFIQDSRFNDYKVFRQLKKEINKTIRQGEFSKKTIIIAENIVDLNPYYYQAHELAGRFYQASKHYKKAINAYKNALNLEVATQAERTEIQHNLEACKTENRKLHAK